MPFSNYTIILYPSDGDGDPTFVELLLKTHAWLGLISLIVQVLLPWYVCHSDLAGRLLH